MATDKKVSAGDRDGKDDPIRDAIREGRPPEEMWARLDDLRVGFERAAASHRSDEMAEMGHILGWLSESPEFRKTAHASLQSFLTGTQGARPGTRRDEEQTLLTGLRVALELVPSFVGGVGGGDSSIGSPTYHAALVDTVSLTILGLLPSCPGLYARTTCPPLPATVDFEILAWDERPGHQEAMEQVKAAIANKLADPDSVTPESLVRAAMRALGVEPKYVKHMFRD